MVRAAGADQSTGIGRPLTLRPAPVTSPLLGIRYGRSGNSLVRLDQRTLVPSGPGLSLERYTGAWSFSPDRRQLVFASAWSPDNDASAAIRFVDVSSLRSIRELVLGPSAQIQALDWIAPERLLTVVYSCCPAASSVSLIDSLSGDVLARHAVAGRLAAAGRAGGSLVLLLEPASFGPVSLAVAGSDGTLRSTVLDRIRAGLSTTAAPRSYLQVDDAGLAIDASGGRAYVVAANDPVAEVELQSLAPSYHTLSRSVSLLGRFGDWLEPKAQAKELLQRSARSALWLGDGRLAVYGRNGTPYWSYGRFEVRTRPSGLNVIDTHTWTSQGVDPRADSAVVARDALLSSGSSWDSGKQQLAGNGLRVYGPDGRKRFQLLGKRAIVQIEVLGSRAFVQRVGQDLVYWVVSLKSGRVLRTIRGRQLPDVLRGAASGNIG
jgi:hypothetical protein